MCQYRLRNSHLKSIQVFAKGVDKETVLLLAARASRVENQDAIDGAIVGTLADPKEVATRNLPCFKYLFRLVDL